MSTWISRARLPSRALALSALALLAGCVPGTEGLLQRIDVGDGTLAIAGPEGFCIDVESSRPERAIPTILMLPCALLTSEPSAAQAGSGVARPQPLLSVSVSSDTADPPAPDALALWASSRRGRSALSRAGRADTVRVLTVDIRGEAVVLEITDTAPFAAGQIASTYWRALFVLRGRLVSASVYFPETLPEAERRSRGQTLLAQLVTALRKANGARAPSFSGSAPEADCDDCRAAPSIVASPARQAGSPAPPRPVQRPAGPTPPRPKARPAPAQTGL